LVDVDSMIGNYDGMVLLPVHDEIVGQVPKAVAYEATKAVEETMADMTNYIVPITADGAYSDESWAAMVD
jgi:DNA polymerase I-like protein with 3'-5' exonuclease and polymerase domains